MEIKYNALLSMKYNTFHKRNENLFNLQIQKIIAYLELDSTKTVLDVGCGAGRLLTPIASHVKKAIGLEYSPNMLLECKQNCVYTNAEFYLGDYNKLVSNDININPDEIYFSYSLHQMGDKKTQLELLHKTFENYNPNRILLITASPYQFDEAILNTNCKKLDIIDRERYLTEEEISAEFNIHIKELEMNYFPLKKSEFINMLQNKYISTLQLLSETEFEELITNVNNKYGEFVNYTDYYTYYVITKK